MELDEYLDLSRKLEYKLQMVKIEYVTPLRNTQIHAKTLLGIHNNRRAAEFIRKEYRARDQIFDDLRRLRKMILETKSYLQKIRMLGELYSVKPSVHEGFIDYSYHVRFHLRNLMNQRFRVKKRGQRYGKSVSISSLGKTQSSFSPNLLLGGLRAKIRSWLRTSILLGILFGYDPCAIMSWDTLHKDRKPMELIHGAKHFATLAKDMHTPSRSPLTQLDFLRALYQKQMEALSSMATKKDLDVFLRYGTIPIRWLQYALCDFTQGPIFLRTKKSLLETLLSIYRNPINQDQIRQCLNRELFIIDYFSLWKRKGGPFQTQIWKNDIKEHFKKYVI